MNIGIGSNVYCNVYFHRKRIGNKFAKYILENYITIDILFPLKM